MNQKEKNNKNTKKERKITFTTFMSVNFKAS